MVSYKFTCYKFICTDVAMHILFIYKEQMVHLKIYSNQICTDTFGPFI
jgi:hypothetical protein